MPNLILETDPRGVRTITLNRPDVLNAFDEHMIEELADTVSDASVDDAVRVVVFRGAGKAFCSGADIGWMARMADASWDENLADTRAAAALYAIIAECPKPTVAVVHGAAFGGGAGLTAVSDVAVASSDAVFAFSEARLGLAPAIIAPYVIAKIGLGAARQLFLTGERFGAEEAFRLRLVAQTVASDQLDAAVETVVANLLACGPEAQVAVKLLLRETEGKSAFATDALRAELLARLRASDEGREGVASFLAKRKPDFAR